jgi:hypothetical protein
MSDRELILESELEQAREMIGDLKNCANCKQYRKKPCLLIDPTRVCSKHEWNKVERREKSYD